MSAQPTSTEQMRNVIQHAGQKIGQALDVEVKRAYPDKTVMIGLAYADGVLDLLAAYLVVSDTDEPTDGMPDGLADGVAALASTIQQSPESTAALIDEVPGLAHAIDRVTRFADPPVDVYAHRRQVDGGEPS